MAWRGSLRDGFVGVGGGAVPRAVLIWFDGLRVAAPWSLSLPSAPHTAAATPGFPPSETFA